jgi:hypothetical protein
MDIRKISIGQDYKTAMHYIVNQPVLNGDYLVHLIKVSDGGGAKVFICSKKNEIFLWKEFSSSMPISFEYNISF